MSDIVADERRFVNRDAELGVVTRALTDLTGGSVKESVLNIWGVPGIGKTAYIQRLVKAINEDLREQDIFIDALLVDLKQSLPAPAPDLERIDEQRLMSEKVCVVQGLTVVSTDEHGNALRAFLPPATVSSNELSEALIEHTVAQLVERLRAQVAERPLLLLIDSCELANDALFAWIEHVIMLPLVHSERVFFVLTSQVMLRWRQYNVRRRVQVQQMGPLNATNTVAQALERERLGQAVFAISFGHPLSSWIVLDAVGSRVAHWHDARAEPLAVTWLEQNSLAVSEQVLAALFARAAPWLRRELRELFNEIALFREFDVNTLRRLLPAFYPGYNGSSQSSLLIVIRQLLETRLVSWNPTLRAYQLDPTVRHIFAHALAQRDEQRYSAVRALASAHYEEQVRTVPSNRVFYLVELFYQRVSDPRCSRCGADVLRQELRNALESYFVNRKTDYRDLKGLLELQETLSRDGELHAALVARGLPATLLVETVEAFRAEVS